MRNIEIKLKARLMGISLRVVEEDDQVRRIVTIKLEHEFDSLIAATLGKDAEGARESLISHGIAEVKIPIDEIFAHALLSSGDVKVEIPQLRGLKAIGKVNVGDDEPPLITLSFECALSEKPWVFFGRNSHAWIDVELKPIQGELPGVEAAEAEGGKKSKGRKGGKKKQAEDEEEEPKQYDDGYQPPEGAAF